MKPTPIRCRLLGALQLAPMTIGQASRCLDARPAYVQRVIADLRGLGVVAVSGARHCRNGRPEKVWRLAA